MNLSHNFCEQSLFLNYIGHQHISICCRLVKRRKGSLANTFHLIIFREWEDPKQIREEKNSRGFFQDTRKEEKKKQTVKPPSCTLGWLCIKWTDSVSSSSSHGKTIVSQGLKTTLPHFLCFLVFIPQLSLLNMSPLLFRDN